MQDSTYDLLVLCDRWKPRLYHTSPAGHRYAKRSEDAVKVGYEEALRETVGVGRADIGPSLQYERQTAVRYIPGIRGAFGSYASGRSFGSGLQLAW